MLLINGKHLRKRLVFPHNISKVEHNDLHVWPYITNTEVGEWELSFSASPTTVSKEGGKVTLTCTAKRVITYTWVNYDGLNYEYYKTQSIENGTCTYGTTFGKLNGNVLTIPNNPYDYERIIYVTAHCSGITKQIAITQGSGSQSYNAYIDFDYATELIPYDSNGEVVSEYIQIYDTVGRLVYADGSIFEESLDETEYTMSYSGRTTTKNDEQTEVFYLCTITLNSPKYGTISKTATVVQEAAPKPTIVKYGEWTLELSADKQELSNKGGNVNVTTNCYRTVYWSNDTTTVEQSKQYVELDSSYGTFVNSSVDVSKGNGSTSLTVDANLEHSVKDIIITAQCNNIKKQVTIKQAAADKTITNTGDWVLELSASPMTIGSEATDVTLTVNCYRTITWSDNSKTTEQSDENVLVGITSNKSVDVSNGAASTTVTISANTTTSQKTHTATATCKGLAKTITIKQAGIAAVDGDWMISLTANPTDLPQEGGTSSIYADCYRIKANGTIEYSSDRVQLSATNGSLSGYSVASTGGTVTLTMGENDETYSIYSIVEATCEDVTEQVYVHVAGGPKEENFWQVTYVAPTIDADDTTNRCTVMFSYFSADGSTVIDTVPATSADNVNIGSISSEPGEYNHLVVTWNGEANTSETQRQITFTAYNNTYDLSGEVSFTQYGTKYEEPEGNWIATGAFSNIAANETYNKASNLGFMCYDGANFTDDRELTSVSADIGTATIVSSGDLSTVEWTGEPATVGRVITITGTNDVAGLTGTWKFKQGTPPEDGDDPVYTQDNNISVSLVSGEKYKVAITTDEIVASTLTISVDIEWKDYDVSTNNTLGNHKTDTQDLILLTGSTTESVLDLEVPGDVTQGEWRAELVRIVGVSPKSDDKYNYIY